VVDFAHMARLAGKFFSFQEYIIVEQDSNVRHEFLDGEVWAMAGGSPEHAAVIMNVGTALNNALRGKPCRTYSSNLRVRSRSTGLASYPDVTVVSGPVEIDADDSSKQTIVNPTLIIEVLSPSTEDYDRGEKLGHYKTIPSLDEVLLVAQDRREIEVVRRDTDGTWSRDIVRDGEIVSLKSIGCKISVDDVYYNALVGTREAGG